MSRPDSELRRAISDYLERSGTSGQELGKRALGDRGFVAALKRGRSVRLDAADRVLAFMDITSIGPRFRREVEAFLLAARVRIRRTALGSKSIGNSSFVRDLRNGASPTLDTVERVRSWMHGFANEFERTGIAWLLASDVTLPPYGLQAAFAPWTDDDEGIQKLDAATFLTSREAAAVLGLSFRTLDRYRVSGEGPAFHKFGDKVLYGRFDLEAWAKARRGGDRRPLPDGGWLERMNALQGTSRARSSRGVVRHRRLRSSVSRRSRTARGHCRCAHLLRFGSPSVTIVSGIAPMSRSGAIPVPLVLARPAVRGPLNPPVAARAAGCLPDGVFPWRSSTIPFERRSRRFSRAHG